VQTPGYDLDRLTEGVTYVANGRNLDSVSLPVPESEVAVRADLAR
jgi:hypothetical protein